MHVQVSVAFEAGHTAPSAMVKLMMAIIYKHNGEEVSPHCLASAADLSSFNFFQRRTIGEHLRFASRTVAQRTAVGSRQTVTMNDNPFNCHAYVRHDGLTGVCVTDKEYTERVAFSFINKILGDFEKAAKNWTEIEEDQNTEPKFLMDELVKFQDPGEADKISKITKELDEIKDVMHNNIEAVLKRGENLDSLMDKSEDLSATSVVFYKKAKAQNACCKG